MENKKLWFKAKRYGWGWYPATWQGVLVIVVYIIGIFIVDIHAIRQADMLGATGSTETFLASYIPGIIVLTALMIGVCYKTGEKPGWHWGTSDKEQNGERK